MEKFSHEANGYNRDEVNQFVSDVIQESEDMVDKYKQQEEQIHSLEQELSHYKKLEASLRETMAQEESNKIIMDAKQDASTIIKDALERAEEVDTQRKMLERNMEIFKKKLKLIVEQQKVIVDKIDELEIQDK